MFLLESGGLYESATRGYEEELRQQAKSPSDEVLLDVAPLDAEDDIIPPAPKKICKPTRNKERKSNQCKSKAKTKRRPVKEKPPPPNNDTIYELSKKRLGAAKNKSKIQ